MRNKAPLALMEQLIMVLVFALAAAVCLQVFVFSDQMSRRNERMDRAVLAAQSAAETAKHTRGDWEQAAQMLGGGWDEAGWQLCYDQDGNLTNEAAQAVFEIFVSAAHSPQPLLGQAEVTAKTPQGEVLFVLPVAWQEVDEHATT